MKLLLIAAACLIQSTVSDLVAKNGLIYADKDSKLCFARSGNSDLKTLTCNSKSKNFIWTYDDSTKLIKNPDTKKCWRAPALAGKDKKGNKHKPKANPNTITLVDCPAKDKITDLDMFIFKNGNLFVKRNKNRECIVTDKDAPVRIVTCVFSEFGTNDDDNCSNPTPSKPTPSKPGPTPTPFTPTPKTPKNNDADTCKANNNKAAAKPSKEITGAPMKISIIIETTTGTTITTSQVTDQKDDTCKDDKPKKKDPKKDKVTKDDVKEACKDDVFDIAILMDGSGSIQPADFNRSKDFVKELAQELNLKKGKVRFSLVQFATNHKTEITFSSELPEIKKAVNNMKQLGGSTFTNAALNFVITDVFEKFGRKNAPNVLLTMTDGESTNGVTGAAKALKKSSIISYALGVGKYDEQELNLISSDPDYKYVYDVQSYDNLKEIINSITYEICNTQ